MSAGDRDTLTDEERERLFSALYPTSDIEAIQRRTLNTVESIVAARVRAAQAQAWDEGWADGQTPFKYPRESNPYESDD